MTRARPKPSTPEQIADRRRFEREEADYIDARAAADPSVIVRKDQRGAVIHAKRTGVFGLLASRKSIYQEHVNAITRLEKDMATGAHEAGRAPPTTRVDGGGVYGAEDFILAAQDRVALVSAHMLPAFWLVLRELIDNERAGGEKDWRSIVRMTSAEEEEACQVMVVRWACQNLVSAYKAIDNDVPMTRQRAVLAGGV